MSLMVKHLSRYPADAKTGLCNVNLAEVKNLEIPQAGPLAGKEPYRLEEFTELVKLGYGSNINMKSATEVFTSVNADTFKQACRMQRVVIGIAAANEQHRG
jgi:hypothetical protein